ncbi:glycosyltransferase [Cellulosilyticum sp. WCF-2]|nr:glycosyltransferase [Cellulosilyticum sp. WCF-2]
MELTYYYTSVNCAYIPRARILAKTIKAHNPNAKVCLVLCDKLPEQWKTGITPFDLILTIQDLKLPVENLDLWIFKHTIREICTAVKGQAILDLFEIQGAEKVIYLDPDIAVFDKLDEIEEILDEYDAALTPHITQPATSSEDIMNLEHPLLTAGLYNLGFIAVKNSRNGLEIARYWRDRLVEYCYDDYSTHNFMRGLYADQKWCSLLPVLFENIKILKSPGYNVARWNYPTRSITQDEQGDYFVNGEKLKFFHFSYWETAKHEGFKNEMNDWYSVQGRKDKCLKNLAQWYHEQNILSEEEYTNDKDYKFIYNYFSNGEVITDQHRLVLRNNIEIWDKFKYTNPFLVNDDINCYYSWYKKEAEKNEIETNKIQEGKNNQQVSDKSKAKKIIKRVVRGTYHILPISDTFKVRIKNSIYTMLAPCIRNTFMYKQWEEARVLPQVSIGNKVTNLKAKDEILLPGLNITGFIKGEFGTAHSARIFINAAQSVGIPLNIINSNIPIPHKCNDITYDNILSDKFSRCATLWCYNADMVPVTKQYVGNENWKNRYNIGLWYWELPDFPDEWVGSFEELDEIWVTSKFTFNAVSKKSTKPVYYVPLSINMNLEEIKNDRSIFDLPESPFLFITMYDVFSINERKNPKATVKAFLEAFDVNDMNVGLVLKVNNVEANQKEVEELREWIKPYKNIYIVAKTLSQNEVYSLINSCDALISLHRSEGFGLSMAEAMYLGKPAIATNWSGNVDFMNAENSCVVDYKLIQLDKDYGPYKAYQKWADPDTKHAAQYMKKLYEDKEYYENISIRGKDTIRSQFSPEVVGERIKQRLIDLKVL